MSFLPLSILVIYLSCLASGTAFLGDSHSHQHFHDHGHGHAKRATNHRTNHRGKTFSVEQIINPCFQPSEMSFGPAALRQAYLKHNIPMTAAIASPSMGNLKGSAIANPNPSKYEREYLVPVTIGAITPQTINLDLDSGSSDLWVFSNSTPAAEATGHVVYKPNTCNSSKCAKLLQGETWSIVYSDKSSSAGIVYSDTVTVGGVAVPSQAVEAAVQVSSSLVADTASSGFLGMAFSSLNTCRPQQQLTWFDNIKTSLAAQIWTANLHRGAPGTYNFGYIDSTAHTGTITYAPVVTSRGLWEFTSSGYQIGSSHFISSSIDAIVDTGTTLILLPAAVVASYWSQVPSAYLEPSLGAYIYPCSSTPPNFIFGIGSYRGVVPGSYIEYGPLSNYWCYGGMQSQGSNPFSIFGDVLLKAQFVVFDVTNLRVGFAPKKL